MCFRLRMRKVTTYEERDRVMALYAPLSLLVLPAVWLVGDSDRLYVHVLGD